MIRGVNGHLEDFIVHILAHEGARTEHELHRALRKKLGVMSTDQGVYRVLRKLQEDGIIIKENKTYSLRIAWIRDVSLLVDTMEETYLRDEYMHHLIPREEREMKFWRFTNHQKLNDFWSQILMVMAEKEAGQPSLNYIPHPWFQIAYPKKEGQFIETFLKKVPKDYLVIGGRTPLDMYVKKQLEGSGAVEVYLAPEEEWIDRRRHLYITVIGSLVCFVHLNKKIAAEIDGFFDGVSGQVNELTFAMHNKMLHIFEKRAHAKVILRRDRRMAQKYYRKFKRLFGPL